jgi:hypothetical protein
MEDDSKQDLAKLIKRNTLQKREIGKMVGFTFAF